MENCFHEIFPGPVHQSHGTSGLQKEGVGDVPFKAFRIIKQLEFRNMRVGPGFR